MLVLLPPSETKRTGGVSGTRLALAELSYPGLTAARRRALSALAELSRDPDAARRSLKLGVGRDSELARNRSVRRSATMPAVDRFDGVLFDALDASSLPEAAREFARGRVAIASALFGLVGALDPIPAYRLSHDSRLPGLGLRALWREPVTEVLAARSGLILDLRSEAYAALGPVPDGPDLLAVRVVTTGDDGRRRALNHFNKAAKGQFTRRILLSGVDHADAASLLDWCASEGIRLERASHRLAELVV